METLPRVSFILPVLNGGELLRTCLRSIREQDYPPERVEIVVADGGSQDATRQISQEFGCVVIDNPRVRAEYGHELAFAKATGEILFIFAADNSLPGKDWIRCMVKPFVDDAAIQGVYTHIQPALWDNSFNRYYCLLHVEPFTWFVYGNTVQPKLFHREYAVREQRDGYTVFEFPLRKYPLIAWAQGFGLRKTFIRRPDTHGDDILPFIQMVEAGCKLAYVSQAGIHHHHLEGFAHYVKKYRARVRNSLYQQDIGFDNRAKYLSLSRKMRKYLWMVYGATLVGPCVHAVGWAMRDREICWLWHVPASVSLAYLIIGELVRKSCLSLAEARGKA